MSRWSGLIASVVPLALMATAVPCSCQDVRPDGVHLELRVLDQEGQPLNAVTVRIQEDVPKPQPWDEYIQEEEASPQAEQDDKEAPEADGAEADKKAETKAETKLEVDRRGHLDLDLAPGAWALTFSRPGYHDLELRHVEVRIPEDPDIRKSKLAPVRVMMQPRPETTLTEAEQEAMDALRPRMVEAPPLEMRFQAEGRRKNLRARGVLTVTNTGDEPLQLPVEIDSLDAPWTPSSLLFHLRIAFEGSEVGFDETFVCEPAADTCQELAPGESVEVEIPLRHEPSYRVGQAVRTTWDRAGNLAAVLSAYLVYPHPADQRQETRTRPVEESFRVLIKEPRKSLTRPRPAASSSRVPAPPAPRAGGG